EGPSDAARRVAGASSRVGGAVERPGIRERELLNMRPRNAALILGAAVSLLASCSLLVPGELPAYRCAGTDPSSCPPAMVCDEATQLCVLPEPIDGGDEEDVEDSGDFDGDGGDSGPAEPSDIGGSCVADRDCKAGLLCG